MIRKTINRAFNLFGYEMTRLEKDRLTVNNGKIRKENSTGEEFFAILLDFYLSRVSTDFFFVQIGANDGVTRDPIYNFVKKYNLPGILVEPVKEVFAELRKNYKGHNNLTFLNAAVSDRNGCREMHVMKESFRKRYYEETGSRALGLSSFDREHIRKHLSGNMPSYFKRNNPDDYIEEIPVQSITFESLASTYNIKKIDLLQIDTEGYDYEIIKMVNPEQFTPVIINYEHMHLKKTDRLECEKLLRDRGYRLFQHSGNTCALK